MERPPLGPASRYLPPRLDGPSTRVGLGGGLVKPPPMVESFPVGALSKPTELPPSQQVMGMPATIIPPSAALPPEALPSSGSIVPTGSTIPGTARATFNQGVIGKVVLPAADTKSGKKKSKQEEMLEIDLTQIEDDQVREMFSSLYAKIEAKQKDIVGLRDLKTRYMSEGKEAFDRDDLVEVEEELKLQEARLLAYEHKLRLRVNHFNSTILKLHKILFERRRILDEADDATQVLTRNPELLERIVSKQLKLEEILETTKAELSAGLMESDEEEEERPARGFGMLPPPDRAPKEWWEEDSVIDDHYGEPSRSRSRHRFLGDRSTDHHKSREDRKERRQRKDRRRERHERRARRKERKECEARSRSAEPPQ